MVENQQKTGARGLLDTAIVGCLFIFAAVAPHSIAATQSIWLIGMLLWVVRFAFKPRPVVYRTPVDYFLLGFFILSGFAALLSYEPLVSIGKLRAASLFTIVYLVAENVRSLRIVRLLAVTLIASCMLNVLYTAGERLLGRGVKVYGVSEASPLYQAGARDGDTLLEVDGTKLEDPQELVNAISKPDQQPVKLVIYRHEWQPTFRISRGTVLPGNTAIEQLGVSSWTKGRDWRASGFFGHYVTYAEVLQFVLALTLGLFVSLLIKRSWAGALLFIALVGFTFALVLTVTRAVWLGCLVSTLIILLLAVRRRTLIAIGLLAIPLIIAGLFILQQKRNVGFFDSNDGSTTWRETVWREGFSLLVSKPRHLLIGVGMDSIKGHWREWGLFDGGRIPKGHMHSNFLQIALERGLPALILWLGFMFVYARTLWSCLRERQKLHWMDRGILLGALGGLVGFFLSGIVHYNWGDSEVVMVFYFIMGLVLTIHRQLSAVNCKKTGEVSVTVARSRGSFRQLFFSVVVADLVG
ncbi:MAG: O-antigen ligase family protein [Acidobacteriota bacterium]|nr:O-antigen ligase family protein [Acidobacteriota bacterium]